jgi:UDP-N-acetylglucosamine 2-epimerase (non-hydrolysing)
MSFEKVALIFGTRPEVIKLYPVYLELRNRNIETLLISTGQQRHLLEDTLRSLDVTPDYALDLMTDNQSPSEFLSRATSSIAQLFQTLTPDLVLVQGDTLSAYAGAQAGYFTQIQVGHVEAGLRSHSLYSPWPEEGIRRAIDSFSNFLWVPTENDLVSHEPDQKCFVTGNTVVDALRIISQPSERKTNKDKNILVTLHRRESFGQVLTSAISELINYQGLTKYNMTFIQHPNPNVLKSLNEADIWSSSIKVVAPIPYVDFIQELRSCDLLITDSGGLQEEATVLNIPTIILRETTERNSAITPGRSKLSAPNGIDIKRDAEELLSHKLTHNENLNEFGDGYAAKRIVDSLCGVTK